MRRARGRMPRNLSRRPNVGVVYNDYQDHYYDYTDYGNYPDTYPDTTSYPDYSDYGDYQDSGGERPGYEDPRRRLLQKILVLEGEFSYLLAGDPDARSSLFEKLEKDDKGRPIGILPALLNQGWRIRRILNPDQLGRIAVVIEGRLPG